MKLARYVFHLSTLEKEDHRIMVPLNVAQYHLDLS
jgi:hypothetical protein